ncbi:hypothetical protein DPMN_138941 [Dreissena polymorpha]|uniref:Uncharacterized protein n=1 Tax=Dreissena polymorpha TaxID=45954 RepID=A0A9D4JKB3_DREPO|nr:hypothetical protein DPMN_138941 [Dreissena polymorpha]
MTSDRVHSFGHILSSQIFWHSAVIAAVVASPLFLISSDETKSIPGDVPTLRLRTDSPTFALSMDELLSYASGLVLF